MNIFFLLFVFICILKPKFMQAGVLAEYYPNPKKRIFSVQVYSQIPYTKPRKASVP